MRPEGRSANRTSAGLAHRLDDLVDDAPHQRLVLGLRHDADQGLGPGFADQHAARGRQRRLALRDRRLDIADRPEGSVPAA
jgi:hypothetical protein